jgi:hypothetical protein
LLCDRRGCGMHGDRWRSLASSANVRRGSCSGTGRTPYTATFMASQYGQAGQQQLPGGYSNGLIPYNPATGALDPAFVSALGFGNTPMTMQQFQQYWNSPSTAFGNFGSD